MRACVRVRVLVDGDLVVIRARSLLDYINLVVVVVVMVVVVGEV